MQARIQDRDCFFSLQDFLKRKEESKVMVKINRSISTDQLKLLLALHFLPIKQVVFL